MLHLPEKFKQRDWVWTNDYFCVRIVNPVEHFALKGESLFSHSAVHTWFQSQLTNPLL